MTRTMRIAASVLLPGLLAGAVGPAVHDESTAGRTLLKSVQPVYPAEEIAVLRFERSGSAAA